MRLVVGRAARTGGARDFGSSSATAAVTPAGGRGKCAATSCVHVRHVCHVRRGPAGREACLVARVFRDEF